jgi:hypothetical protein
LVGYEYVVVAKEGWDIGGDGRVCRVPKCNELAVARMRRRNKLAKRGWTHWAYCGRHLYGGWIENNRVVSWRLRKVKQSSGAP